MKLGPPIFILAVGASTLAHIIGVVLLIEITKKNASFYQEKVTLTLLPSSAVPTKPDIETPIPLSPPMHSNPLIRPNQWHSFAKQPTLVDPETSIASIPPSLQIRELVHQESTIQTLIVQPKQAEAASKLEAMTPLKQDGKSLINKSMEAAEHLAISKPSTEFLVLQTHRHFLHEHPGNTPPASPPLHSSSTKTPANQPRSPLDDPAQNARPISLISRNESVAEYKLKALGNKPPTYPRAARKQGLEGRVVLSVMVTSSGLPKHISVFETSGAEILDYAAVSAIAKWHFVPAKIRDTPVDSKLLIPIRFQLKD